MLRTRHVYWALSVGAMALGITYSGDIAADTTLPTKPITPFTMQIAEATGHDDKLSKYGGAGNEQAFPVYVEKDGRKILGTIAMNSDVEVGYWQGKWTAIELKAEGPEVIAGNVQLTNYSSYIAMVPAEDENGNPILDANGDPVLVEQEMMPARPFNHPTAVALKSGLVLVAFGSDNKMREVTALYAGVLDPTNGQWVIEPEMIAMSEDDNDVGAPYGIHVGTDSEGNEVVAIGSHDNVGGDYVRLQLVAVAQNDEGVPYLDVRRDVDAFDGYDANIARPVLATDPIGDTLVICSALGDERPPEIGVGCALVHKETGDVLTHSIIAESNLGLEKAYNQPSIGYLKNSRYAVGFTESNSAGKGSDTKGFNRFHLVVLDTSAGSIETVADSREKYPKGLPFKWSTHAAICTGSYGLTDKASEHIAIMGASVTGVGQPTMDFIEFSPQEGGLVLHPEYMKVTNEVGDSGHLSNAYGNNPGEQGRDFLRCAGNVPNPGYGIEGAWWPEVKYLFAQPIAGSPANAVKNGLYMSLIAGEADVMTCDDAAKCATPQSTGDDGLGGPGTGGPLGNEQAGGCVCGVGRTSSQGAGGAAALLALGLLLAARRRKED